LYGRAGLDILRLPIGGGRVYGGTGSDVIDQSFGGTLYGGPGNDNIDGLFNTNIIYPGSGRDSVEGGPGDDTVIIYDVCELEPLETLDGGLGNDTLITPVSLLELGLRGVIVVGFNNIVVDASNRHLADCF
jgi:Ca2+-binding RTX toxin-like protein